MNYILSRKPCLPPKLLLTSAQEVRNGADRLEGELQMKHRSLLFVPTSILVLLLSAVGSNATETNGSQLSFEDKYGSSSTNHFTVNGTVTTNNGAKSINGARVQVLLWPESLEGIDEGETFTLPIIGEAITATDGTYSIAAPAYEVLRHLDADTGTVDATIIAATSESNLVPHETTLRFNKASGSVEIIPSLNNLTDVSNFDHTSLDGQRNRGGGTAESRESVRPVGSESISLTDSTGDTATQIKFDLPGSPLPHEKTLPLSDLAMTPQACATKLKNFGPRTTYVGSVHSTVNNGFTNKFQYTTGGSSSLQTAYRAGYPNVGKFSRSSNISRSTSGTTTWPAISTATHRVNATQFNYAHYRMASCTPQNLFWHVVKADYHAGGATTYSAAAPTANYCVKYGPGSGYTKTATKAVTWSAGAKLGGTYVGMDLTSSAGYSSSVKLAFKNTSGSVSKRLCGTHGYPANTPSRWVVKSS